MEERVVYLKMKQRKERVDEGEIDCMEVYTVKKGFRFSRPQTLPGREFPARFV
jgi:hypothetical protein